MKARRLAPPGIVGLAQQAKAPSNSCRSCAEPAGKLVGPLGVGVAAKERLGKNW